MKKVTILIILFFLVITSFYLIYEQKLKIGVIYFSSESHGKTHTKEILNFAKQNTGRENVELYFKSSDGSKRAIEEAVSYFAANNVKHIIGPDMSSEASYLLPLLEKEKMIALAPKVTSPDVIGKSPYFYSIAPPDSSIIRTFSQHISRQGTDSLIIYADQSNTVYVNSYLELFNKHYTGKIISIISVAEKIEPDFFNNLAQADGVLMVTGPKKTGILAQKVHLKEPTINIYSSDYGHGAAVYDYGGNVVWQIYTTMLYSAKHVNDEEKLASKFRARGIAVNQDSINYYDTFNYLLTMIEKHGRDPELLKNKFRGSTFPGFGGIIKINEAGITKRDISIRLFDLEGAS